MSFRGKPQRRCRGRRYLTTTTILVTLAACGGGSTDVQTQSEGGTYHLVTVNGQSLPVSVTTTSGTVSIQSASVVLTPGTPSTYTASMTGSIGGGSSSSLVSDAGTYVRSGSSLTFTSSSVPLPFAGTIKSNGHIVVALPGAAIGAPVTLQLELAKS